MWLDPSITLQGPHVRLEPLLLEHASELFAIGQDDAIWRFLVFDTPRTLSDMERFISIALQLRDAGSALPFVVRDANSGKAMGSTRFMDIDAGYRVAEIGWTWFGRSTGAPEPMWRVSIYCCATHLNVRTPFAFNSRLIEEHALTGRNRRPWCGS